MVSAHLLGQIVCSDRGMWPWALKASMGAESWRERCTVPAAAPTKPLPTGTAHLQPPGLFLLMTGNRYSIPIRATSGMDLLFSPCLLAVPAAALGQGDSHQSQTQSWLSVQWQLLDHGQDSVRREKQLIFSEESRGTHKDASSALSTSKSTPLMSHFLWDRRKAAGSARFPHPPGLLQPPQTPTEDSTVLELCD